MNHATLSPDSQTQPGQQPDAVDSSAAGISEDPRRAASNRSGWWWTLAGPTAACDSCKAELSPGQRIAYHYLPAKVDGPGYAPAEVYCPDCAKSSGVAEICKASRKLQSKERALGRHAAKVRQLEEALESRRIKVLELRKALL